MYYVIQKKHFDPNLHYLAFRVPKYIANKNSKNIIFEFIIDGKAKRKWAPKDDIILLTDDADLFQKTLERFEAIKERHNQLIEEAKKRVDDAQRHYENAMQDEFLEFQNPTEPIEHNLLNSLK